MPEKQNGKRKVRRGFDPREKEYILSNYQFMSDSQMAPSKRPKKKKKSQPRSAVLANLDEEGKRKLYLRELKKSVLYKAMCKAFVTEPVYIKMYEEKYMEFMTDPSIETMTSMECDILHEMIVSQIREVDFMRKEKEGVEKEIDEVLVKVYPSYNREIVLCQERIAECQKQLNVQRVQRLKDTSDQAINFTHVVRELRQTSSRYQAGQIAAMFKYMGERDYNKRLNKHIISGADDEYDVGSNFKDGKVPQDLGDDFTGDEEIKRLEDNAKQYAKKEELFAEF
jgi:hypothetical protein